MENIPAKKSLGQNFLKSKVALDKMLSAGEVNNNDIILEVGPGKGVLTEKLLAVAKKVIAVEKDDRLIPLLQEKFASEIANGKLEIIHDDILNIKPNTWHLTPIELPRLNLRSEKGFNLGNSYKIIANIPYYITGIFLRKFLEETDRQPERIVVMVQKEIAQRIVANEQAGEKESLLSISVKAYGQPKLIMKVDKENFSPAPKVDSAILLISHISKKSFTDNQITEGNFFTILHAGFAHKRKMLLGNLKEWQKKDQKNSLKNLSEIFEAVDLSPQIRAEDLKLEQWFNLTKQLS
jgi:16S rRNA (adenine1518-N6/adenine1519-N6)-dimethyltransferase